MFKALSALCLILSLTGCSYFTDKVYQDPRGKITLTSKECKVPAINDAAPPEIRKELKEAVIEINGQGKVRGCWTPGKTIDPSASESTFVIAENGGYALFPNELFK